jgi:uncharacterized protein (TIGR00255 family)
MIQSMTAFARAEERQGDLAAAVEIRSVNSRYLDLTLRLSNGYGNLEERLKAQVSRRIDRGRVDVRVKIDDISPQAQGFSINVPRAAALRDAFLRLKTMLHLEGELQLDMFTSVGDIIHPVEAPKDPEGCWRVVEAAAGRALDDLIAMREREGRAIAEDFSRRLKRMEYWIGQIAAGSRGLLSLYQARLLERIGALTEGATDVDPLRIAQEAAILADRSDISEEIVRTRCHVEQFRAIMDSDEPGGRKLNFLLQELVRELNTLGSKTERAEFAHMVVEMKCELEKIREQVQNVE